MRHRLGNYEIVRLLAEGGMADVYLARQLGLERHVALKVLDPARAADPDARALFHEETRLAAILGHANLATVYDAGADAGVLYLAMEYVDGADLRAVLAAASAAGARVPYDAAIAIACGAAAGLEHAHGQVGPDGAPLGLVHRDVSLSNIMVTHDGQVKVIDFGIARARGSRHRSLPGTVRGKTRYMSPEQCLGRPLDARSDVFALGIVLYELTCGRHCFDGESELDRMLAIVRGELVAPRDAIAGFPRDLERVILTALDVDPACRHASAAAFAEALEQVAWTRGWLAGAPAVARLMRELFAGEPAAALALDLDDPTVSDAIPEPQLTLPIGLRRPLAA